jgi:hypothetical protein
VEHGGGPASGGFGSAVVADGGLGSAVAGDALDGSEVGAGVEEVGDEAAPEVVGEKRATPARSSPEMLTLCALGGGDPAIGLR